MSDSETRPFSGARFWRWYALAWLDLAGLYAVVFLITGQDTIVKAVTGALAYVTPMAVLGVGVLAIFRRLDWSAVRRPRLVTTQPVRMTSTRLGQNTIGATDLLIPTTVHNAR